MSGLVGEITHEQIYFERLSHKKIIYTEGVNREVFELQRDNESEFGKTFVFPKQKASIGFFNKTKSFDTRAEKWLEKYIYLYQNKLKKNQ